MNTIGKQSQELIKPYVQNPPDPAILFTLPNVVQRAAGLYVCLLYTSPSPRDS